MYDTGFLFFFFGQKKNTGCHWQWFGLKINGIKGKQILHSSVSTIYLPDFVKP
jgi:hypothetical protein